MNIIRTVLMEESASSLFGNSSQRFRKSRGPFQNMSSFLGVGLVSILYFGLLALSYRSHVQREALRQREEEKRRQLREKRSRLLKTILNSLSLAVSLIFGVGFYKRTLSSGVAIDDIPEDMPHTMPIFEDKDSCAFVVNWKSAVVVCLPPFILAIKCRLKNIYI